MKNNTFPKNCKECENECDCHSAAYGVGTCKYRTQIELAAMETFLKAHKTLKVNEKDVREILTKMGDVFAVKNEKYGNSFEVSVDKYGMIAALTRISDKFNRIENLILNGDGGTDDETVMDTLIDMANYCVMTAVYMKNVGGENHGKNK